MGWMPRPREGRGGPGRQGGGRQGGARWARAGHRRTHASRGVLAISGDAPSKSGVYLPPWGHEERAFQIWRWDV
eukprot:430514-Prymnesium_polylepis.1